MNSTYATAAAASPQRRSLMDLTVQGMSCASCVGRVERALRNVPGVLQASVNLATERAQVETEAGVAVATLIDAVAHVGYTASAVPGTEPGSRLATAARSAEQREAELKTLQRSLLTALGLSLPVFGLEMGAHLIPALHAWIMGSLGMQASWGLQLILTLCVLLGPGRRFFVTGLPALLHLRPDMNSLVAVGTLSAFGYSLVAVAAPTLLPAGTAHVYFEAAAVIVTLILMGRFLEARAKGRTSDAIQRLLRLQPASAEVLRAGEFVNLPIAQVVLGDSLRLKPGARVAVDGVVLEGETFVDESMLTGEPLAVKKGEGSQLAAGTVNQNGSVTFRVTAVGKTTLLAQIVAMVEQAQAEKLPIQAVVDRVSLWFVPSVMAVSVLTFVLWLSFGPEPALSLALVNAVSVLIVACPCAMGLATPMSILVGTGKGAELGLLFRHGEALQRLRDVRVVALDKTGTLTLGRPTLTDIVRLDGEGRADPSQSSMLTNDALVQLVASVEARSEHPIARALVDAAKQRGLVPLPADGFEAVPGMGLRARVASHRVEIGADRFFASHSGSSALQAEVGRLAALGKTPLVVAIDGALVAVLAVADPLQPGAKGAIRALRELGLKVGMVTGDNQRTAQAVAAELGIDDVMAEVLPAGKVAAVLALSRKYGSLAFVGDGINDAPALAAADVGIAIGTGTDIAIQAADVVLVRSDLTVVPQAIALSRATIRNIHQNLFWAFAYNTALIPLAAGALYPFSGILLSPMLAALGMALSSVFVLGNALRLRRFKPSPEMV